jgi:mannose-6-phosphate isomerase-like protein (cupin superfamily)
MYKDSAPNPIDLFSAALHLGSDGQLRTGPPQFAEGDHWQVACFRVATDAEVHADHWEVHPAGEEAVCCVSGAFRVHLRAAGPDGADSVVRLRAGEAILVRRGVWQVGIGQGVRHPRPAGTEEGGSATRHVTP